MKKRIFIHIAAIIVLALITGFIDLPQKNLEQFFKYTAEEAQNINKNSESAAFKEKFKIFFFNSKIHLGLDLQGGTQLDYKIDLRKVPRSDREIIVEGVREVINRRVNNLGVAEPNIYLSKVADEQHIIVELAGIKDIEEAKKVVGKTIQLEFKEERTTSELPEKVEQINKQAKETLDKIGRGEITFEQKGEEESKAFPNYVQYQKEYAYAFADEITKEELKQFAFETEVGKTSEKLTEITAQDNEYTFIGGTSTPRLNTGFALYKVVERKDEERKIEHPKEVAARQILISYKGAESSSSELERTQEEAQTKADEVLQKLKQGTSFVELVKEYSDDETTKNNDGLLTDPIIGNSSTYPTELRDAGLKLTEENKLSEIIKTSKGFYLLQAEKIKEASTETKVEPKVKLARIVYSTLPDPWQETALTGKHFVRADVQFNNLIQPYVTIQFDDEGGKLFEQLTEKNVGKSLAIFVGGDLISSPRVNEKISGGSAQITGRFTIEEAQALARDLNTGAIPAPITLSGQYTIGASLGETALKTSLDAGKIGILLLALYLILFYRLPGLLSVLALSIYAILLMFLVKVAMPLAIALFIAIFVFIIIVIKILKSPESGWEKFVSFILACFILFFLTFLLTTSLVLTLAGIAGIILSIGMAVDANILIFERMKEELKDGRPLASAIDIGFERAWSSIRDSNFSSLITCGILFYFGSSIIRGFAFNLATGILVSMFSAITVTKFFLKAFINTKTANNLWLLGVNKTRGNPELQIIKRTKTWLKLSGSLIVISIFALLFFGLKLGLDFTGGTLMEIKFQQKVNTEAIRNVITETESNLKNERSAVAEKKEENIPTEKISLDATGKIIERSDATENNDSESTDFGNPNIVLSGENTYLIRIKHIRSETHTKLLDNLKQKFGELEEKRFTIVGPTLGKSLAKKAVAALVLALIMIVLYIAFAFRHVPKYVNPWRFGICAIIALFHDVLLTIGLFSILSIFNIEIDALFVTALLTIIGFSVHDTIVVFDRIRENLKLQKRDQSFADVANVAVNQTMTRSINTSVTTLITLLALLFLGGEAIRYFVLALVFGITVGTYSSIFIASPLLVVWKKWKER